MSKHAVLWIDQKQAHVIRLQADTVDESTVHAHGHESHGHPRGAGEPNALSESQKRYFHDVAQALRGAEEILVVGPSTAKLAFVRYLHKHDAQLESKIVGVETVDHPTDHQLIAYGKTYFDRRDWPRVGASENIVRA